MATIDLEKYSRGWQAIFSKKSKNDKSKNDKPKKSRFRMRPAKIMVPVSTDKSRWEVVEKQAAFNRAYKSALDEEMPIQELEVLGLSERFINILEDSGGIFTLNDLRYWSKEELQELPHFGEVAAKEVKEAIELLPYFPMARKAWYEEMMLSELEQLDIKNNHLGIPCEV